MRQDTRFSQCEEKSMEKSKSLNATLPAATRMPANRREFLEPAAAGTLAAVAIKSGLRPILSAAFLLALALGVPMASLAAPCGGPGQRACCNGDGESAPGTFLKPCEGGLSYANGCTAPDCSCSGGIITSVNSLGMCYQATPCGGEGQRACCNG